MSRNYIIFFDPGSTSLTPRAKQILEQFYRAWTRTGGILMELHAGTDGVEARFRPASLALARAAAAKAFLVAQGLEAQRILTYGPDDRLVPSDGPEPQNRNVQIWFTLQRSQYDYLQSMTCRIWIRDHCFVPTRLPQADARACNAALDGVT